MLISAAIIVAVGGLLLGARFKAAALAAASVVVACGAGGAGFYLGWTLTGGLWRGGLLLAVLQSAYLVGLTVSQQGRE